MVGYLYSYAALLALRVEHFFFRVRLSFARFLFALGSTLLRKGPLLSTYGFQRYVEAPTRGNLLVTRCLVTCGTAVVRASRLLFLLGRVFSPPLRVPRALRVRPRA